MLCYDVDVDSLHRLRMSYYIYKKDKHNINSSIFICTFKNYMNINHDHLYCVKHITVI